VTGRALSTRTPPRPHSYRAVVHHTPHQHPTISALAEARARRLSAPALSAVVVIVVQGTALLPSCHAPGQCGSEAGSVCHCFAVLPLLRAACNAADSVQQCRIPFSWCLIPSSGPERHCRILSCLSRALGWPIDLASPCWRLPAAHRTDPVALMRRVPLGGICNPRLPLAVSGVGEGLCVLWDSRSPLPFGFLVLPNWHHNITPFLRIRQYPIVRIFCIMCLYIV
jgi:hypothetical protein